jgi:hypothetical protein
MIFNEALSAIINSMEQCSSREASTCLDTRETSRVLYNTIVHFHIQNLLPTGLIRR